MSLHFLFGTASRGLRVLDRKIAIIGALAIALVVLQTSVGHSLLLTAGLSRPTPSFVELYLPGSKSLPANLPASGRLTVRFALSDVGPTKRTFLWQISQSNRQGQLKLASGRAVVNTNQTDTILRKVRVSCSGRRTRLLVSVKGTSAMLALWLACPSHR